MKVHHCCPEGCATGAQGRSSSNFGWLKPKKKNFDGAGA